MKAYDYAELFMSSYGTRGEFELREYIAQGGNIHEKDDDDVTAGEIVAMELTSEYEETHNLAQRLAIIIKELGGNVTMPTWAI